MAPNPLFCIRLTPDERALLDALAEREHLSAADMFRKCLRWFAENIEPAKVKAKKARAK